MFASESSSTETFDATIPPNDNTKYKENGNFPPYLYLLDTDNIVEQTASKINQDNIVWSQKLASIPISSDDIRFYKTLLPKILRFSLDPSQQSAPISVSEFEWVKKMVDDFWLRPDLLTNEFGVRMKSLEFWKSISPLEHGNVVAEEPENNDNNNNNDDKIKYRHSLFLEQSVPFVVARNNQIIDQERWDVFLQINLHPEMWSASKAKLLLCDDARHELFRQHQQKRIRRDALPFEDPERNRSLMPSVATDERIQQYIDGYKLLHGIQTASGENTNDHENDNSDSEEESWATTSSEGNDGDDDGDDDDEAKVAKTKPSTATNRVQELDEGPDKILDDALDEINDADDKVNELLKESLPKEEKKKSNNNGTNHQRRLEKDSLSLRNVKSLFAESSSASSPPLLVNEGFLKFLDQFEIYPSRMGVFSSGKEFLGPELISPVCESGVYHAVTPKTPRSLTFYLKLVAVASEYSHESSVFADCGIYLLILESFPVLNDLPANAHYFSIKEEKQQNNNNNNMNKKLEVESAIDFARIILSENSGIMDQLMRTIEGFPSSVVGSAGAEKIPLLFATVAEALKPLREESHTILSKLHQNLLYFFVSGNNNNNSKENDDNTSERDPNPHLTFYKKQVLLFSTLSVVRFFTEVVQKLEDRGFLEVTMQFRRLLCTTLSDFTFPILEICAKESIFIESFYLWIDIIRNCAIAPPEVRRANPAIESFLCNSVRDELHALRPSMVEAFEMIGKKLLKIMNRAKPNGEFELESSKFFFHDYYDYNCKNNQDFGSQRKSPLLPSQDQLLHYEIHSPTENDCDAMKVQVLENYVYLVWGLIVEVSGHGSDANVMSALQKNGRTTSLADSFVSTFLDWEDAAKFVFKKRQSFASDHRRLYALDLVPVLSSTEAQRDLIIDSARSQVGVQLTFFTSRKLDEELAGGAMPMSIREENDGNDDDVLVSAAANTNSNKNDNKNQRKKSSAIHESISSSTAFVDDNRSADELATTGLFHTNDRRHAKAYLLSPRIAEFWRRFVVKNCVDVARTSAATGVAITAAQYREAESFLAFWLALDECFGVPTWKREKIFTSSEITNFERFYLNATSISVYMAVSSMAPRSRTPKFRQRTVVPIKTSEDFNMLLWISILEGLCTRFTKQVGKTLSADNFQLFDDFLVGSIGTCIFHNCDFYADVTLLFLSTYSAEMRIKIVTNKDVVQFLRDSIGYYLASDSPLQMLEAAGAINSVLFRDATTYVGPSLSAAPSLGHYFSANWRRIGSLGLRENVDGSRLISKEQKMEKLGYGKE